MSAKIEHPEIGFPVGENIQIASLAGVKCTIVPTSPDGDTGVITITIPYQEATVENSPKPKERLFSIGNTAITPMSDKGNNQFFIGDPTGAEAWFTCESNSPNPANAKKELHVVIKGNGPKKNSSN